MNEAKKNGEEPSESNQDQRLSPHPKKRMRSPADMLRLTPEVLRELIANRARFLWQNKGLLPELEEECWLEAEAELNRKV